MSRHLPVILLLIALPVCGQAQNARLLRASEGSLVMQLVGDIYLLQQIVPLQLTDAQLAGLLELYEQDTLAVAAQEHEAVAKLQQIKQRLLAGTPLVATDWATVRDAMRQGMRGGRGEGGPPTSPTPAPTELTALEQAAWALLDTRQKAILLGDVRGPAANNQKADVAVSKRAMAVIAEMLQLDDTRWTAARDKATAALAAGAGEPNSPAVTNSCQLFRDFFDRLRKMPPTDFAKRQDELAAELLALLPPQTNLIVTLAEFDTKLIHGAMSASLLHPRAPEVLRQMQAARTPTQAQ